MRRGFIHPLDHADDFAEFFHQRGFIVQPPGSIHQQQIKPISARRGQRIKSQPCRIGTWLGGCEKPRRGPPSPDLQLFHRRGAEGIAGDKADFQPLFRIMSTKLGDGGGLARAIHTHHQHHMRRAGGDDFHGLRHRVQNGGDFIRQRGLHFLIGHFLAEARAAESLHDASRSRDTQISGDQGFFQLLQSLIIQPPLVQQGDDAFRELGSGTRKPRLQPREPASLGRCFCLRLRDFRRRCFLQWGRGLRNLSQRRFRRAGNRYFRSGLGRATAAQTAKEIAQRHQAASAKSPSASAPVTRRRRISPGCPALPSKRSGAKYSVWPRSGCSNKTCSCCPSLAAK